MKRFVFTLAVIVSAITTTLAHPGHGTSNGHSPEHYMTSPLHVLFYVAVAAGLVYLGYRSFVKQSR